MESGARARRRGDAGFLLVEAQFAAALVAVAGGIALAAVACATHAAARALPAAALAGSATNVLTDLRAATAYDPAELAALAGREAAFDARELGAGATSHVVHIVASVARASGGYVATVTASGDGAIVTLRSTLAVEAPQPGSVAPAGTPPPAAQAANDTIAL